MQYDATTDAWTCMVTWFSSFKALLTTRTVNFGIETQGTLRGESLLKGKTLREGNPPLRDKSSLTMLRFNVTRSVASNFKWKIFFKLCGLLRISELWWNHFRTNLTVQGVHITFLVTWRCMHRVNELMHPANSMTWHKKAILFTFMYLMYTNKVFYVPLVDNVYCIESWAGNDNSWTAAIKKLEYWIIVGKLTKYVNEIKSYKLIKAIKYQDTTQNWKSSIVSSRQEKPRKN